MENETKMVSELVRQWEIAKKKLPVTFLGFVIKKRSADEFLTWVDAKGQVIGINYVTHPGGAIIFRTEEEVHRFLKRLPQPESIISIISKSEDRLVVFLEK